jgi:hypothetical protein
MLEKLLSWHDKFFYPERTRRSREKDLSVNILTSASPAEIACERLAIPENVQGLTIVDLASGVSPLVADLLGRGAHAEGVDILYSLPTDSIIKRFNLDIGELVSRAPKGKGELVRAMMTEAMHEWERSFLTDKEKYHAAFLTNLPQASDIADLTVSSHGISNLAMQRDIFWGAITEAVRITKPGGKFVMAPLWQMDGSFLASEHRYMLGRLSKANLGKVIVENDLVIGNAYEAPFDRLTIIKS